MKTKFLACLLLLVRLSMAHEMSEEVSTGQFSLLMSLWQFHDAVHWMIFLPFIATCYYFRYLSGRKLFRDPKTCGTTDLDGKGYKGEIFIVRFHRIFFWLMLIFVLVHFSETVAKTAGLIEYDFALFRPFVYPFTEESHISAAPLVQFAGSAAEWLYVMAFLAFLASCHYFRHFLDRSACFSCPLGRMRGVYMKQSVLNTYHGALFWLSIGFSMFLLLMGGHL